MRAAGESQSTARGADQRLPYSAALDGIRGLAVTAVLLFHGGVTGARGGFLGVSVFFTLSGFLITSLVVSEHARTGRVDLGRFWARRARRLIPASLLALGLAGIVVVVTVPGLQRPDIVNDMRAALLNVANWRLVQSGAAYGDLNAAPSPVQHYWSLAIEEQFYLVFPLLAAVTLRRRVSTLAVALGAITVLSVVRQLTLDDTISIYYGTDTRAAELAIGGLLAIAWARTDLPRTVPRWMGDASGAAALVALLVLVTQVDIVNERLFDGAFAVIAVVSSLLVLGALRGRWVPRLLEWPPLVQLGRISYGVYLFHFPLFVFLDADRTDLGRWPLLAVRVVITIWLASASFLWLESPVRAGRALRRWRAPAALVISFVALAAVSIPLSSSGRAERRDVAVDADRSGPLAQRPRAPRILVVGDSSARSIGEGLRAWGEGNERLVVDTVYEPGCGILLGKDFVVREGYVFTPSRCDTLLPRAVERARQFDPDAVVVFTGSSQLADWRFETRGGLNGDFHIGDPMMDLAYQVALEFGIRPLEELGVPILWASLPVPDWDLEVFAQELGQVIPGDGPVTINDAVRTARLNELTAKVLSTHPLVSFWPFAEQLERPDGTVAEALRPDGLHLSKDGVALLAEGWLSRALDAAFDDVVERAPAALLPPRQHAWSVGATDEGGQAARSGPSGGATAVS